MKRRSESAFGLHFDFHASPAPGLVVGATLREEDIREICRLIRPDFNVREIASVYENYAQAVSVLAEEDFFHLGGDSLHAMELIAEEVLPGLTIPMIYEGRTARRICSLYEERTEAEKNRSSEAAPQMQASSMR